jgi:hypothetical protein
MYKNVIKGSRRSGKSSALMKLVVDAVMGDSERAMVIAPNSQMLKYLFNLCLDLATPHAVVVHAQWPQHIELDNGHTIYFLADAKKVGQGHSLDFIAIDEHTFVSDEFKDAIIPCASGNPNARIWMTEVDDG